MATLKLSQIASSPANAVAADTFVGVHGGNTDYQFTLSQMASGLGPIIPITPGTTPISGGTDTCILFDKAGVVGEDTNFEWDYTNHILNLGPNALLNSIGTTWRFDVGGNLAADFGVTASGVWHFDNPASLGFGQIKTAYLSLTAAAGGDNEPGVNIRVSGDTQARMVVNTDSFDSPNFSFGPGGTTRPDTYFYRNSAGVAALLQSSSAGFQASIGPAGWQIYNSVDKVTAPTNFERAVFDWTTTSNVLTIGTQKGGSGSTRAIQFVSGNTNVFDYGVTNAGILSVLGGGAEIDTTYFVTVGASGTKPGSYIQLTGAGAQSGRFYLDGNNNIALIMGPGSTQPDINLNRQGSGIFGIQNQTNTSPASLWVYNTSDTLNAAPSANYERGVFDWTTTSNVLTIGTQAGGSGKTRPIIIIAGDGTGTTTVGSLDFDVTTTDIWTANTALAAGGLRATADPGGVASTNTMSNVNSATISTGVGVIHMSTGNPATNSGWLKCYIGTQVAWIPCWTTNAP